MVGRLPAILVLPLLLSAQAAAPASDLTAVYVNGDGREGMRIEIAANGDLRITEGPDRYWLSHGGETFMVVPVAIAVGLVHMLPQGRLLSVCGRAVTEIYWKLYTIERWTGYDPTVANPGLDTVPFFGMTRTPQAVWAVGIDGLYRVGENGMVSFSKMPAFETIDGISVSFALPDLVLVRTTINQRVSLGGAVPMLVPRQ